MGRIAYTFLWVATPALALLACGPPCPPTVTVSRKFAENGSQITMYLTPNAKAQIREIERRLAKLEPSKRCPFWATQGSKLLLGQTDGERNLPGSRVSEQAIENRRCCGPSLKAYITLSKHRDCLLWSQAQEKARKEKNKRNFRCPLGARRVCLTPMEKGVTRCRCISVCRGNQRWDTKANRCVDVPEDVPVAVVRTQARRSSQSFTSAVEKEVKSGRCATTHYTMMRRIMAASVNYNRKFGRHYYSISTHKILVAQPKEKSFTWSTVLSAEYHLVVISATQISLKLIDGNGYPLTDESFLGRLARMNLGIQSGHLRKKVDSRQFTATGGEKFTIKLSGRGCTLVMIFRRFP